MAYAERCGRRWRARYKTPNGGRKSKSGFKTKREALSWGRYQETDAGSRADERG